jgi:hypothetical protein
MKIRKRRTDGLLYLDKRATLEPLSIKTQWCKPCHSLNVSLNKAISEITIDFHVKLTQGFTQVLIMS